MSVPAGADVDWSPVMKVSDILRAGNEEAGRSAEQPKKRRKGKKHGRNGSADGSLPAEQPEDVEL